jgi:acetyltransferase-like isoleucine patch superfamily enzyme
MLNKIIKSVKRRGYYLYNRNRFRYLAPTVVIQQLLRIEGKKNISIAENVIIQKLTWLAAVPLTNAEKCHLSIGKGTVIGNFNHIFATGEITIGEKVLTADKVFITDNQHEFEDVNTPILEQGIKQFPPMSIGNGTWIGENVCILGVSVGKNCVIGANSVVNKPIPDYCIAVGIPAKVIKKYNFETKQWEKA